MKKGLTIVAAALSVAAIASSAQAQLVRQESAVATGVVPVPGAPSGASIATAIVRTYQPVCELRREQFQDEYGWRVRDVWICR